MKGLYFLRKKSSSHLCITHFFSVHMYAFTNTIHHMSNTRFQILKNPETFAVTHVKIFEFDDCMCLLRKDLCTFQQNSAFFLPENRKFLVI